MKVFSSPTNVDMHPLYPTGHLSTNSDFLEGWYWLHFPSFLPGKSLCKLCSSAFLLGPSSVHTKQLWLVTRNRSKEYADKDKQERFFVVILLSHVLNMRKMSILCNKAENMCRHCCVYVAKGFVRKPREQHGYFLYSFHV